MKPGWAIRTKAFLIGERSFVLISKNDLFSQFLSHEMLLHIVQFAWCHAVSLPCGKGELEIVCILYMNAIRIVVKLDNVSSPMCQAFDNGL